MSLPGSSDQLGSPDRFDSDDSHEPSYEPSYDPSYDPDDPYAEPSWLDDPAPWFAADLDTNPIPDTSGTPLYPLPPPDPPRPRLPHRFSSTNQPDFDESKGRRRYLPQLDPTRKDIRKPQKPGWQERFLAELAKDGMMVAAAKRAGINHNSVYKLKHRDANFAAAIEAARAMGSAPYEQTLAMAATVGLPEDVYFEGEVVGTRRIVSIDAAKYLTKSLNPAVYDRKLAIAQSAAASREVATSYFIESLQKGRDGLRELGEVVDVDVVPDPATTDTDEEFLLGPGDDPGDDGIDADDDMTPDPGPLTPDP